jgi:hypothetical protein
MPKVITVIRAVVKSGSVKIRLEGVPLHFSQSMIDMMNLTGTKVTVHSRVKECWNICEDCDCMPKEKVLQ